jgi:polyisoprenoid-binding protein YceI
MMAAAAAGRIIRRNAQRGLLLTLLLPAGFACSQSSSAAVDLRLDPATTSIHWTLGATAHTVHGSFQLKSGAIHVDPATGNASGLIVIDATTGQSGDKARDRRMHRDVLESAKYPEITFRPVRVLRQDSPLNLTAPGMFTLEGILTLHGQEHSLSLSVTLRPGPNGLSGQTQFDIPYVAWGMKDPSTYILRVEKQVHLTVEASATPAR